MTPEVFLRIANGKLILWNYRRHEQYEIDESTLARLVELSTGEGPPEERLDRTSQIDQQIEQAGFADTQHPPAWGWDCLSRIFHIGTQIDHEFDPAGRASDDYAGYIEYCNSIMSNVPELTTVRGTESQRLPPPDWQTLDEMSLGTVLAKRYTCRDFSGCAIPLQELSTALWATFGAIHGFDRDDYVAAGLRTVGYRRSSPSGGCLQPSEPYLLALRVEGLEPGIYHYRSHQHTLGRIGPALDRASLTQLLCGQSCAEEMAYGVFLTSRFDKMWWKYPHSRAYRVALMDIGCLAQTFQLVCTARGIQSWLTGYIMDHQINRLMKLDADRESAMFFLGAGFGSGPIARGMRRAADALGARRT